MADQVQTSLSVTYRTDQVGQQIVALVQQYVTGFASVRYGWRTLGTSPDITFPAFFVVPRTQEFPMETFQRYHLAWRFDLFWFCTENTLETMPTFNTNVGDALAKLLSNNALGNLNGQYMVNTPYWYTSKIGPARYGDAFINPSEPSDAGGLYINVGQMSFIPEQLATM